MVASRHHGHSDFKLGFIGICSVDAVVARGSTLRGRSDFMLRSISQVATSTVRFSHRFRFTQYFCYVEQRCLEWPWP